MSNLDDIDLIIKEENETSDSKDTVYSTTNLLPDSSKERYEAVYNAFIKWKIDKKAASFSENVLLTYFSEIRQKYLPSTIWAKYSMLRSMIKIQNDVDISQYSKLLTFIKQNSVGFKSKKAKVLTSNQVREFLNNAPNDQYLALKVIAIFGITGACRTYEMVNLKITDIEDHRNMYLVNIPETRTNIGRSFIIAGKFYNIVHQYMLLRPSKALSNRFFLNFRNNKCTCQVIGKNIFSQTPRKIATFLNLPNPDHYTGHCFRRTSTTLLADAGADRLKIGRCNSWKSNTTAESHTDNSINTEKEIDNGNLITSMNSDNENSAVNFATDNSTKNTTKKENSHIKTDILPEININNSSKTTDSNFTATVNDTGNTQKESSSTFHSAIGVVKSNTNESVQFKEINFSRENIVLDESIIKNNTCNFNFSNCNVTINYGKKN